MLAEDNSLKFEEDSFYMVWNPGNYPPTKRHKTREEAIKEAHRLCNKQPNTDFYVLEALCKVKGEVSVTEKFLNEKDQ